MFNLRKWSYRSGDRLPNIKIGRLHRNGIGMPYPKNYETNLIVIDTQNNFTYHNKRNIKIM